MSSLDLVSGWLASAPSVVTFSGAGLSKASGIPTYRDAGGLWTQGGNLRFSRVEALQEDPAGFREFWGRRLQELQGVRPNAGHLALAALERRQAGVVHVTQNVDGLLAEAGCVRVHELHGRLTRWRCDACGARDLPPSPTCPHCGAMARPDVVMFGEMVDPRTLADAELAAKRCGLCLVVGTSAQVWPAAGLVEKAKARGARIVVVNVAASQVDDLADVLLRGPAEEILPALVPPAA